MNDRQSTAPSRNYDQSMGLWLNEPLLRQPERIAAAVAELAAAGYGFIRLFLRNSNYGYRSPEVVAGMARAVAAAHRHGMRAAMDCEPHDIVGRDMIRSYPDAMGCKLVRCAVPVVDGHWRLRAETPALYAGAAAWFDGFEAAFLRADGQVRRVDPGYSRSRGSGFDRNGNIHRELFYREGVPGHNRAIHDLRGQLPGVVAGELIVYVRYLARNVMDFWAEGFQRYYEDLLDCYREVPLDGIGWDEPAIAGDWHSYRYGEGFAAAFARRHGYALADRLYLLDEPGLAPVAVQVRLDYYRTLNEGLAQAQANLIAKARALFGPRLLLGTHHTWQGEGGINDYRAGAVDYFRLTDNMDAGYSDCSWWDPASVAYAYVLAASLARLTPSGEAEANTWHQQPTVANVRRNVNLMSLMNITWFNIWFGGDCDCVLQQGHYTWPETVAGMHRHQALQRRIGRRQPVADVAIWHGWEGVCAWNREGLANAQKSFCLNTSELFINRSIAVDFIDSRLLAASRSEGDCLVNELGRYRVLVLPYALALPRRAFAVAAAFAQAGGRVIFVGTPVAVDEEGQSLAGDFARLLGTPEIGGEHYLAGLAAVATLPPYRPQRLEVCRPLPAEWPRLRISCEGETHGVASPDGHAIFLSDLDPGQRLIECLEDKLSDDVRAYGDNLLWRLYRGPGGDCLAVAAREDRPLRGLVRWAGQRFELTGGSAGIFELTGDGRLQAYGDLAWHTD